MNTIDASGSPGAPARPLGSAADRRLVRWGGAAGVGGVLLLDNAWAGAQSVFDTMLVTGVLLVPIGLALLGVAMRSSREFGSRLAVWSIGVGVVGVVGFVGAAAEIVEPSTDLAAVGVLAIALFHPTTGWRMLRVGATTRDSEPAGERTRDLPAAR